MDAGVCQERGVLVSGRFAELEDALVERVRERRAGRSLSPLMIIVGSSALSTRINDLLVRRLGAVANVSVVTLARAAKDAASTAGSRPACQVAPLVRERLVRRLVTAKQESEGLRYFGPVSAQPHFARALAGTFEDLRQARVPLDEEWNASSSAKAADLRDLYSAYCAELVRLGLSDDAALLATATTARERAGEGVSAPPVILYGMYDLNEAQTAFVRALLAGGADLFSPWPRAGADEEAPALVAARAAGLKERRAGPPPAADDLDRVAACLSEPRFPVSATTVVGDGSFLVVSAPDERSEVREAAREVLAALTDGGAMAAWECAVVVPHADDVERFAAGLRRANLPVACRLPDRSVSNRLLLRLLDCLAPAAGKPFARRAVLDLFTVSLPRAACDGERFAGSWLWADEARRAGIVCGLDQWTERSSRRRHGLERRLAALEAGGDGADGEDDAERLERVRLRLAASAGLEAAAAALATAFVDLPARTGWAEWAGWLAKVLDRTYAPEVAAAAGDAVGRLRALDIVGEEIGPAEMAGVLRQMLSQARVPAGRVGRDGVAVLTPLELRGLRFHTVVFAGLAEGAFPSRGSPDPIFGDGERRRLGEALSLRLPLAEARDAESALLFALAAEAATARLVLVSPRTDAATGRSRLPSRLLLRLASAVAGRPVGLDEFLSGEPLRPVWRRVSGGAGGAQPPGVVWTGTSELDIDALLTLSSSSPQGAGRYLSGVLDDEASAQRRLAVWRAWRDPAAGPWDGLLGPEAAGLLAARGPLAMELHPTRLEAFISCPFPFLLRDLLGLYAPQEPDEGLEIDPMEFGSLAHEILERAYTEVIARDLELDDALIEVEKAHRTCCAAAKARGVTGDDLAWGARRTTLLEDLLEAVRRDPVFRGGGRPMLVEWRFGEASGRPVLLDLGDGRRVRFAGRIDRIDRTGRGARIVDYKTGRGETEASRLKAGLAVQLPVYRLAIEQAGDFGDGEEPAETECLYQMVTRRGSFATVTLEASGAESGAALTALIARIVRLAEDGVFVRSTAGRCVHCDVRYACGASEWTRGRKRRDQRLAPLVGLQRGELEDAETADVADES